MAKVKAGKCRVDGAKLKKLMLVVAEKVPRSKFKTNWIDQLTEADVKVMADFIGGCIPNLTYSKRRHPPTRFVPVSFWKKSKPVSRPRRQPRIGIGWIGPDIVG